jgi:hypothetical protein
MLQTVTLHHLADRLPAQTELARKLSHRHPSHDTRSQVFDPLCRPVVLPAGQISQQPVELSLFRRGDRARHVGAAGAALADVWIPAGVVHDVDQLTEQELPDGRGVQELPRHGSGDGRLQNPAPARADWQADGLLWVYVA